MSEHSKKTNQTKPYDPSTEGARTDFSDQSFPQLVSSAFSKIFSEFPAKMPGSYDAEGEPDTSRADDLSADESQKFAENNAFVAFCALLVLSGIIGIALLQFAITNGEPLAFPLLRTAAILSVAICSFLLWGFYVAFPGDFNGIVAFPHFGFPGQIDSLEYGMGGMSEWTDLFYIATYAGVFGSLLLSFCSLKVRATATFLFVIPITCFLLPLLISWKWGAGWLDGLQNNSDFAGAGLIHWHAGAVALCAGGIVAMFLRQPANAALLERTRKKPEIRIGIYAIGLGFYFLLMIGMNAGSILAATPDMVMPVLQATLISAAVSAVLSTLWWIPFQTRSFIQFLGIGLIGGAISVSAAADSMSLIDAAGMGIIAGMIVPGVVVGMDKLVWPDPLAVGPVHGIGGALSILGASMIEIDGLEVSLFGQLLLLFSVPLLSLVVAFFVLLIAGTTKFLFVTETTVPPGGTPPLSRPS